MFGVGSASAGLDKLCSVTQTLVSDIQSFYEEEDDSYRSVPHFDVKSLLFLSGDKGLGIVLIFKTAILAPQLVQRRNWKGNRT